MISLLSLASPKPSCFPRHRRPPRCAAAFAPPATAVRSSAATLYEVLGIAAGATGREIKAAYRRLALACHPDAVAAERKRASADEFMRVRAAYETLSDPEKRADYDRRVLAAAVLAGQMRQPFYPPRSSPYSSGRRRRRCRTWETDQCW